MLSYIIIGILIVSIIVIIAYFKAQNEKKEEQKKQEKREFKEYINNITTYKQDIKENDVEEIEEKEANTSFETPKECPYYRAMLLSKNEWHFYKDKLQPFTEKYRYNILAKVRMEDVVGVKRDIDKREYSSARGKVRARHFDFILVDKDMHVLLVIELDDKSHENIKSQIVDKFKNETLEAIKLPYIRVRKNDNIEDRICETLKINKK